MFGWPGIPLHKQPCTTCGENAKVMVVTLEIGSLSIAGPVTFACEEHREKRAPAKQA